MEPDYYHFNPNLYSNEDMEHLADDWFDASKQNLSSNQAEKLYEKTANVFSYLQRLENSLKVKSHSECIPIASKMSDLCNALISGFNKHGINESRGLALWIAEHTIVENTQISKYRGAYNPLHDLVNVVRSIKENYDYAPRSQRQKNDISDLKYVDSASEFFIEAGQKTGIPDNSDIKQAFITSFDLENLMAFRSTSKQNKEIVNELLVESLNEGKIIYNDLDLHNIDQIKSFFEEQASKISLNFVIQPYHSDDRITQICNWFPNMYYITIGDGIKITEKLLENLKGLNALKVLDFENFNDAEAFNSVIENCPHLVSISITDFESLKDISALKNCTNLNELYLINCPNINADLTFENNSPLQTLVIAKCSVKNINCPSLTTLQIIDCPLESISCPELHTVDLRDCAIEKDVFEKFIHLRSLTLANCNVDQVNLEKNIFLEKVEFRNCNFTNLLFLGVLKNLKSLAIENCPIISINIARSFPLLEHLEIMGCKDVTDIAVLLDCPSLKTAKLAVDLPENDVQADLDYENVLVALTERGVEVTEI